MNATQNQVSDGSLNIVNIGIKFFNQADISVSLGTAGPLTLGVDYVWNSGTAIKFLPTTNTPGGLVPNGIEVLIRRHTEDDEMLNIFDGGAPFSRAALDENFEQLLFLSQEFREGLGLDGLRNDLNMNGYKVTNVGPPLSAGDAANKGYIDSMMNRALRSNNDNLNALPAAAFRASKLLSFDASGQPVLVAPASGSATDLALSLANGTDPSKGANQVAYDPSNSVKQAIDALKAGAFPVVDSVAAIAALPVTGPKGAFALGFLANGLGGGMYRLRTGTLPTLVPGYTILASDGTSWWELLHNGTVDSSQFGCSTALANNATFMQNAINTVATFCGKLTIQTGTLTFTSPIEWKNGCIYEGRGVPELVSPGTKGTHFEYTGTADFSTIKNAINGSTSANIEISGIWFSSSTLGANNALLFDTASSVVLLTRCRFNSNAGGLIMDQSELWDVRFCSFLCSSSTSFGVWLVNGTDKNATSQQFFTNRICFWGCEWNGAAGAVAVYDDGGAVHAFVHCNFNACGTHIIHTAVTGLLIHGGEYEVCSAQMFIQRLIRKNGNASPASVGVVLEKAYLYNNANQTIYAAVTNAVTNLTIRDCEINTPSGNIPFTGLDQANITNLVLENNVQTGLGGGGALINNYYSNQTAIITWTGTTTNPAIGNGVLAAKVDRRGKEATFRLALQSGSTTTYGSGRYVFTLPFTLDSSANVLGEVGSCFLSIPGVGFYSMVARRIPGTNTVEVYNTGGTTTGPTTPGTWVSGTVLEFQIKVGCALPM